MKLGPSVQLHNRLHDVKTSMERGGPCEGDLEMLSVLVSL